MTFVIYDTETTGTDTKFDQILQFAAIATDDELKELENENISLRCRLQPHIVPAPGALLVTGISADQLLHVNKSHYEMMSEVREWLESKSPAIFLGYNSIRFDETLLRQAFYQTLRPIYLTNTNQNCRGDVMRMAQAAAIYSPDSITVPADDRGRSVFRLGDIARANGIDFDPALAHEALADVRATRDFADFLKSSSADIWAAMIDLAQKPLALDFTENHEFFCMSEFYFGRPYTYVVTAISPNAGNPNEIGVFDLAIEPTPFLNMNDEELLATFKQKPRAIRSARLNSQPILMPFEMVPENVQGGTEDVDTYMQRSQLIRESPQFQQNVSRALERRYEDEEPSPYVEGQIFDRFAGPADQALMDQYHNVGWNERVEVSKRIEDQRFAELGRRLVFFENPDALDENVRAELQQWTADRLLTEDEVPWLTIPKALQEVDDLVRRNPDDTRQLEEIRGFLLELADRHRT